MRFIGTLVILLIVFLFFVNCVREFNTPRNITNRENQTLEQQKAKDTLDNDNASDSGSIEKIEVISHWDSTTLNDGYVGEVKQLISKNTENLYIGGQPLTITKIRGIEKLNRVKSLILYGINNIGGMPSDVMESVHVLGLTEELFISNCYLKDLNFINKFLKLKKLAIHDSQVYNKNLDISNLKELTELSIYWTQFEQANELSLKIPSSINNILFYSSSMINIENYQDLSNNAVIRIGKETGVFHGDVQLKSDNIKVFTDEEIQQYFPRGFSLDEIYNKILSYEKIGE